MAWAVASSRVWANSSTKPPMGWPTSHCAQAWMPANTDSASAAAAGWSGQWLAQAYSTVSPCRAKDERPKSCTSDSKRSTWASASPSVGQASNRMPLTP